MAAPGDAATDPEEVARLRLAILRLSRRLRQQGGDPITPSQLSVLATVARHGPIALGELAAVEGVQPPTVTRIVGALEEAGLVVRRQAPADRRSATVEISGEGRRRLDRIRSNRDAWLARRLEGLSAAERADVASALPALERLLGGDQTPPGGAPQR